MSLFPLVSPRWVLPAAIGAAFAFVGGWGVTQHMALNSTRTELARLNQRVAETAARAEADARARERQLTARFETERQTLQEELTHAQTEHTRVVADLQRSTERLRQRFSCPTGSSELPDASSDSHGAAPDGARGFTPTDGVVALGIAADGDARIARLNARLRACVALLESERVP